MICRRILVGIFGLLFVLSGAKYLMVDYVRAEESLNHLQKATEKRQISRSYIACVSGASGNC